MFKKKKTRNNNFKVVIYKLISSKSPSDRYYANKQNIIEIL